ncbi:MAG: dihydropyrimidinase [Ignavibacterium sp.]|nr:dihydropyrimidinase [Ignavibacterium sp.]
MQILIKKGLIISPPDEFIGDVFINNGKIEAVGENIFKEADRVIDAKGKFVIPGGIDVHTHLDMPYYGEIKSRDDFYTGTLAAAFGGTTTIIDFPTQTKGEKLTEVFYKWMDKANEKAVIDYSFHMIITDLSVLDESDFKFLLDNGITSIKIFTAYPDRLMLNDRDIFSLMMTAKKYNLLVMVHAENGIIIDELIKFALSKGYTQPKYHAYSRPPILEAEAINRVITYATLLDIPIYIVHNSSYEGLRVIKQAREKKKDVFAETCPQYLYLSIENITQNTDDDYKFVFTPPVREKWNQEHLWNGLNDNSLQVLSTDHCPFNFADRMIGKDDFTKIPNGGAVIEHRLELSFKGVKQNKLDLRRWVEINSTNPAKIFGMYPKKGTIKVGSDADIVIWNPEHKRIISKDNHHMNIDYSMFEGVEVSGKAEIVISNGEIIIENDKFVGSPGRGKFIQRKTYSEEI